jgi:hypothetical protein
MRNREWDHLNVLENLASEYMQVLGTEGADPLCTWLFDNVTLRQSPRWSVRCIEAVILFFSSLLPFRYFRKSLAKVLDTAVFIDQS